MHFVVVLSFFSSLILTPRVPIIPFFPSPYISGVCQKNKSWCKLFWCRSITLVLMFALFSFYTSYIIKLLLKCVFFFLFFCSVRLLLIYTTPHIWAHPAPINRLVDIVFPFLLDHISPAVQSWFWLSGDYTCCVHVCVRERAIKAVSESVSVITRRQS